MIALIDMTSESHYGAVNDTHAQLSVAWLNATLGTFYPNDLSFSCLSLSLIPRLV